MRRATSCVMRFVSVAAGRPATWVTRARRAESSSHRASSMQCQHAVRPGSMRGPTCTCVSSHTTGKCRTPRRNHRPQRSGASAIVATTMAMGFVMSACGVPEFRALSARPMSSVGSTSEKSASLSVWAIRAAPSPPPSSATCGRASPAAGSRAGPISANSPDSWSSVMPRCAARARSDTSLTPECRAETTYSSAGVRFARTAEGDANPS